MSWHIRNDKLQNNCIWEKIGVVSIKEKMMETRLRWFGYVQRRSPRVSTKKVDQIVFSPMKRGSGISKKILKEVIKMDI